MTSNKKGHVAQIAAIASSALWILGFALAFVIPAHSALSWLPDTMLLVGFWPLLFAWKPGWPWVVFGVLNIFVGFFLLVAYFLPDTNFTAEMIAVRRHLAEQHSPYTWMLIGLISVLVGLVRMAVNLGRWLRLRREKARH